jgi:hypothetical protein
MITKALKAFAMAGALAGATVATAYAFQTPVELRLNSAVVGGQDEGFDRLVIRHRDQMETGGREVTFVVLLQGGADYRLAARCGADCINLNLSLRDARGREVAADLSGGDLTGFNVRAPYSGAYSVTLAMESCRTPRCQVGAVVLGRSTPSPDA